MKRISLRFFALLLACWQGGLLPAIAEEPMLNTLHIYFGQYTTGSTGESANPIKVDHEENYLLAAAYTREFWDMGWRFHLGGESGLASRFGEGLSLETWGGLAIRHRGVTFGNWLTISPAITAGLSVVTETIGKEAAREDSRDGDATWLFYLGPEVAISLPKYPRWELVYRLQHRSGADGILGGLAEGHNANTLGVRWRF
jgi:hypothetical protein